jgi:hypothetical protein
MRGFCQRRQHSRRRAAAGSRLRARRLLEERDVRAVYRQPPGAQPPDDAGSDYGDAGLHADGSAGVSASCWLIRIEQNFGPHIEQK